jgi:hypothetical protein
MITTNEILTTVFSAIKAIPALDNLTGGIYKKTRPTDSVLEDIVISNIAGTGKKFLQDGALYVKIFYKDFFINNTYYEDSVNGQAKEALLISLSETLLKNTSYSFDIRSREVYTEAVEELHQHYAILKINYQLTV